MSSSSGTRNPSSFSPSLLSLAVETRDLKKKSSKKYFEIYLLWVLNSRSPGNQECLPRHPLRCHFGRDRVRLVLPHPTRPVLSVRERGKGKEGRREEVQLKGDKGQMQTCERVREWSKSATYLTVIVIEFDSLLLSCLTYTHTQNSCRGPSQHTCPSNIFMALAKSHSTPLTDNNNVLQMPVQLRPSRSGLSRMNRVCCARRGIRR